MQYVFKAGLKFARLTSNLHLSCFGLLNAEIIDMDHYAWLFNAHSHQHIGAKMTEIILELWWHRLGREFSLDVDMGQRRLSRCRGRFHLEAEKSNKGGCLTPGFGFVLFVLPTPSIFVLLLGWNTWQKHHHRQFILVHNLKGHSLPWQDKTCGQEWKVSVYIASAAGKPTADRNVCWWATKP